MHRRISGRATRAGLLLALLVACGHDAPNAPPPSTAARRMVADGATTVEGVVGTEVPAPTVRVVDARNRPVAGIPVRFAVISGFGSISNDSATTNADGLASAGTWTLDTRVVVNVVLATSDSVASVRFTALGRGGRPVMLTMVTGDDQLGVVNSDVQPPVVRVLDKYGNGVADVAVAFAGFARFDPAFAQSVSTSDNGLASPPNWQLGSAAGTYAVTASVPDVPSVVFRANAVDDAAIIAIYELTAIDGRATVFASVRGSTLYLTTAGQFIEDTEWTFGELHDSGRYTLADSILTMNGSRYAVGTIADGALTLVRDDPDFGIPVTWLYTKRR